MGGRLKLVPFRLQDFLHLLPKSVSRDKTFVSALHAQTEKSIGDDVDKAFNERFADWDIENKLGELDGIVRENRVEGKAWWVYFPSILASFFDFSCPQAS